MILFGKFIFISHLYKIIYPLIKFKGKNKSLISKLLNKTYHNLWLFYFRYKKKKKQNSPTLVELHGVSEGTARPMHTF